MAVRRKFGSCQGARPGVPPGEARPGEKWVNPKPLDYYRDYDNVDTIHGIPMSQFRSQDIMVNESQGDIVNRSMEHLGAQDHIVTVMRNLMFDGIRDVQAGRDPKHIIRAIRAKLESMSPLDIPMPTGWPMSRSFGAAFSTRSHEVGLAPTCFHRSIR